MTMTSFFSLRYSRFSIFLSKILNKFEIDKAVFFGLLTRLWSVVSAPVTILLIVSHFSPELQGYYYTFANLLALQVFMELGLGTVIVQFASHEWAKLSLDKDGYIVGDEVALSRLTSLARLSFRWYGIGSVIASTGLMAGGYFFFAQGESSSVNWMMPWFSLCLLTGVTVFLLPMWSLLEGCNQVNHLYAYRFFQSLWANLFLWIAVFSGAKLWAASAPVAVTLICAIWFLTRKYKNFLRTLIRPFYLNQRIAWRKEILPMQWRLAISWMSGYFVFFLFTPVLFKFHGPVVAGQFGMTWSIISIIGGVAWAWFAPKIPQFGMLISKKDYKKLDTLFWHTTKVSFTAAALMAGAIWFMFYILVVIKHPVAERFLPLLPAGIFLLANVVMFISMPFSAYLRAHKREPIFLVSVISGILIGLSTLFLGKQYSALGMSIGYLVINLFMIPIIIIIWYRCKNEWHQNERKIDLISNPT